MASDVSKEIARLLGRDPICNGRVTMDTVEAIATLVADATAIERERCAGLSSGLFADANINGSIRSDAGNAIAAAIRKGPTP